MISPQEIKTQALKWWKPFLQSHLKNETFFPKSIDRIGKISSSALREKFGEMQTQLDDLYKNAKDKLGYGYVITKEEVNFRRTGSHSLPQSITFESIDDYISFIDKKKDWSSFLKSSSYILQQLPQLKDWLYHNPLTVIEYDNKWEDILKVCTYFINNPKPEMYVRQLPIDLHTKFIEQNETVIKLLLDALIPEHRRDISEKSLVKRFYLKYDEPTIRLRILDNQLQIAGLSDLRIPLADFNKLILTCSNILLTENKMNFLALPALPSTIAIWSGGGFLISYLSNSSWLKDKNIFYWGDLDAHGFQILHQMRSYFPQTKSVMMDKQTFDLFSKEGLVAGEITNKDNLSSLTSAEFEMFKFLKTNNLRLEQEKIRQDFADKQFRQFIPEER